MTETGDAGARSSVLAKLEPSQVGWCASHQCNGSRMGWVKQGGEGFAIRALIRWDQMRSDAIARMQVLIDEGLRSGEGGQSMAETKAEARRRAGVSEG